jgi:hypothetical protein
VLPRGILRITAVSSPVHDQRRHSLPRSEPIRGTGLTHPGCSIEQRDRIAAADRARLNH